MDERTKAELIAQGCKVLSNTEDKIIFSCPKERDVLEFRKETEDED